MNTGDYAGLVRPDETVSGWESLSGDLDIKEGDRVLLCRHREVPPYGFDWGGQAIHEKELYVGAIVTVDVDQRDGQESKLRYISFRLLQWHPAVNSMWWRARDAIKVWPGPRATCLKCGRVIVVAPKTRFRSVGPCPECGAKRSSSPLTPRPSGVFFDCSVENTKNTVDEDMVERLVEEVDKWVRENYAPISPLAFDTVMGCIRKRRQEGEPYGKPLILQALKDCYRCFNEEIQPVPNPAHEKDYKTFSDERGCEEAVTFGIGSDLHARGAHEKSRAGIKERMEALEAELDELGPEEDQVGGYIDLRGWLDRPVGVPSNLPRKKHKVEL